jgi:putative acetyltransferase
MIIRSETPADYKPISDIHIAAFANHPYSRQTEHLIVDALRAADATTISLVAEIDGSVVGHIAFSPVKIDGKDGLWFGIGPLAVLPSFQRQGIGTALVNEGLNVLRGQGAHGCVLVGDPAYYTRFGFRNDAKLAMHGVPAENLLCLSLIGPTPAGEVAHHPAFFVGL